MRLPPTYAEIADGDLKVMAEHPPLRRIAGAFVRYANLTFGGGTATVAVLNRELVAKRGWIDEQPFGLCCLPLERIFSRSAPG